MVWQRFPMPPRRWQREALPVAMAAIRRRDAAVIQACTGAGKSWFIAAVCASVLETLADGWHVVVTVPTESLVEQTAATLAEILGDDDVGRWYGRAKRLRRVVVCCYPSLSTLADQAPRVACWIADECHRTVGDVVATVERLAPVTRVGLTATPFRRDSGLHGWSTLAYAYGIDDATADGVLVPFSLVCWTGSADATADEATAAMIAENAPAGPGIVSAASIDDAESFADYLVAAGIPAAAIHSRLPRAEQTNRIEALRVGDVRCLVHVALLTEGVDLPWLRWLAMRRVRRSPVAITQEVGRVLRTMREPDCHGEKTAAVVLLPHVTPVLASLYHGAKFGGGAAAAQRMLNESVESVDDVDAVGLFADAVGDVPAYLASLVRAVSDAGVALPLLELDWRASTPTRGQLRQLSRRHANRRVWGGRFLPREHREPLAAIVKTPEVLTAQTASLLVGLLNGLNAAAGEHRRAALRRGVPSRFAYWPGIKSGLPPVPDAVARWSTRRETT